MPNHITKICKISGCSSTTTYLKRHCRQRHRMCEFTFYCYKSVMSFHDCLLCYNIENGFVCFRNAENGDLLLKFKQPIEESQESQHFSDTEEPSIYVKESSIHSNKAESQSAVETPREDISLTPRKMNYSETTVRGKLQNKGLYTCISDTIEDVSAYRHYLVKSTGSKKLNPKVLQRYNCCRKLLYFLSEGSLTLDYSLIFNEQRIDSAFDALIDCGVKGESLVVWISGLESFVQFLYERSIINKTLYKRTKQNISVYSRQVSIVQRKINVSKRRKYISISRENIKGIFSWMEKLKSKIIPCIRNEAELDSNTEQCIISYIVGIILRLGQRPQVATNFTTKEYLAGKKEGVFYVSNIKSQETGSASFPAKTEDNAILF